MGQREEEHNQLDVFDIARQLNPPFAFTASQGGLLAQPPLAIPPGTRLRGPSGSLRCSIYRGVVKLVASLLRQPTTLYPDKSALLARVNGDPWVRALLGALAVGQ